MNQRKAPRWSRGFTGAPHRCGFVPLRLPQRVPVSGYRRRGRPVVNFIDKSSSTESAALARMRRQGWHCLGSREVSFLELTPQLVRGLDFGIGSEGSLRIITDFVVVQFS